MNNKKILSTTIMFIIIVAVVVGFKSLFGDINTLVGVAGLTAALSLIGTDYTINPIKSTIFFVSLEVLLGVTSFWASTNALLGLIVTFCVIFFILYEFTYNTKKPTYVAFALGYFFMLYTPVNINQLPTRLVALAFCGLAIMAVQMIANRNKIQSQSKAIIIKSIEGIKEQITIILENSNQNIFSELNTKTNNLIKDFNIGVYERLDSDVSLPISLDHRLFISKFLENVNTMMVEIKNNPIDNQYVINLNNLKLLLTDIDTFITDNNNNMDSLVDKLDIFLLSDSENRHNSYLLYKLEYYVSLLKEDLLLSKDNLSKKISEDHSFTSIATAFTKLRYNLNKDSLKFTFAFRGALVTSLGVFIVSFFNIPNGKWLVFSLLSVIQPYLETSKAKGKERIIGTVIGLIIFEVLFTIVTDNTLRTFMVLLTGYISNYQTKYKYQMTCTTISSLGAASIGSNINELALLRITLVLIGTIIALYSNKVILPYSMVEVTKKEIKKSIQLNKRILSILYEIGLVKGKFNDDLRVAVTNNMLLNSKIEFNNNTLLSEDINEFLYNQRIFFHKLHFLINNSKNYLSREFQNFDLFYNIDMTLNKNISSNEIIDVINKSKDAYSKLILIDSLELKKNIELSTGLSYGICKKI